MRSHDTSMCLVCGVEFRGWHGQPNRFCSSRCYGLHKSSIAPNTLTTRFWAKVDKNGPVPTHRPELGPCWLWTASTKGYGYGQLSRRRGEGPVIASRLAWELVHGPIPAGLWVLHHCDNPPCVNAEWHLFLGTREENILDRDSKGRVRHGESHASAKLSAGQVARIRELAWSTPQLSLAREFGVSQGLISGIIAGKVRRDG